jgi:hypothetical protein
MRLELIRDRKRCRPWFAKVTIVARIEEADMSDVVYTSNVRIERVKGPLRLAYLPGESQPVTFSVHGAIAEHYKVDPSTLGVSHASTIDYVIAATAG